MGLKRRTEAWRRRPKTPTTLHPRLHDPAVLRELRNHWIDRRGCIRIEAPLFAPGLADAIVAEMRKMVFRAFELDDPSYGRCFFWRAVYRLEHDPMPEIVSRAADFAIRDFPWLVQQVTGWRAEIPEPVVGFTQFREGCFLDVHNEYWDRPGLGFVVGLSRAPWPVADGGWLTFYGADKTTVLERRPPGWDTVDLYTTDPDPRWHAVSKLETDHERLTMAGLLVGTPP